MNVVITKTQSKENKLPKIPFIVKIEGEDLRMVSSDSNNSLYFFLTDFDGGYTWTSESYTLEFLKDKIQNKLWLICEATLDIKVI